MPIKEKLENNEVTYDVSINFRSKLLPEVRVQRLRTKIKTLREAQILEKQLSRECAVELSIKEKAEVTWGEAVEKWELAARKGIFGAKPIQTNTIWDNTAALRRFTEAWLKKPCQSISPSDVRRVLSDMVERGYSKSRLKAVKSGINVVYKWGIEEGLIKDMHHSPSFGIELGRMVSEKPPQILSLLEIQKLLEHSRAMNHEWYPIWAMALNTGMRSGELYTLEWNDIDFDNKLITVSKSYNGRLKLVKCTKAGYWRKVPMNKETEALLIELRTQASGPHVLPRISQWRRGEAARILREYCVGIGINNVCFHALRACFATHLLNSGITSPVVKKICGWTDEKVMTRYIRLAGIDVAGATEGLTFIRPVVEDQQLVNLSNFRMNRKDPSTND